MRSGPFLEDEPLEGDSTMDIVPTSPTPPLRRSMRVQHLTRRFLDSVAQQDLNVDPVIPHTILFVLFQCSPPERLQIAGRHGEPHSFSSHSG